MAIHVQVGSCAVEKCNMRGAIGGEIMYPAPGDVEIREQDVCGEDTRSEGYMALVKIDPADAALGDADQHIGDGDQVGGVGDDAKVAVDDLHAADPAVSASK